MDEEDDNFSQSSQAKQRNQWLNEGASGGKLFMKDDGNDDDPEAIAMGPPAAVVAMEDDQEYSFKNPAPASAQRGTLTIEYEDKNQSAASSSSKAKQSGRKSMHSLEPNQNLNNAAGGAEDSNLWKGEDNSAMSKKSFTTTPSQQLHKRTLKEGKRMQEDLLQVQSILEE